MKPYPDEIHTFLEWRRRTRFVRHYGGPIMAVVLFATCLWFVWKAFESRQPLARTQAEGAPQSQEMKAHEVDHTLQASKFFKPSKYSSPWKR